MDGSSRGINLMPMGKYRGVPIGNVVDYDPDYVGWLVEQDWFFQRYPRAGECLVAYISIGPGTQPEGPLPA